MNPPGERRGEEVLAFTREKARERRRKMILLATSMLKGKKLIFKKTSEQRMEWREITCKIGIFYSFKNHFRRP